MDLLNEQEVERVWSALDQQSLASKELGEDLLDHFCCAIEELKATGKSFEESLELAFARIAPHGVEEISYEWELMMSLKPHKQMKKILYLSGFITAFCISMTILLRTMHWNDYANVLQVSGFLSLLLFGLPAIVVMAIRNRKLLNKIDMFRMSIGVLAAALFSVGMIFKTLHFPGAGMFFSVGMLLFTFIFLPIFFIQLYQRAAI